MRRIERPKTADAKVEPQAQALTTHRYSVSGLARYVIIDEHSLIIATPIKKAEGRANG